MLQNNTFLVSLSSVGIYRTGHWLVRGVDLTVEPGEIVTLIGPNGSGKSTTAKISLGLLDPDEGIVTRRNNLTISYVPQKVVIDWTLPLTVKRFIHLTGRVDSRDADKAMAATGISHLRRVEVCMLSGGEFQRVMLARAIARKPDFLVLDEPIQGVDFTGEIELYDLIKNIRDDLHCGVLLISHDLHMVMAATDRVICLNGHVCCSGTPTDVIASEAYQTLFGTRAIATLAFYNHSHDHTHLSSGQVRHADGSVTYHFYPGDGHHHDHDHDHDQSNNTSPEKKTSHAR